MKQPNAIVIMADQLKATALNLYGNTFCSTMALERLAKDGTLFKNAFTPHPLCVPARVSMWTSQFPHANGARRNETFMPESAVHAFKIWKKAGYYTGLIGKNHCFKCQEDLELFDTWCEITHRGLVKGSINKGMDWVESVADIENAHRIRNSMPNQSQRISYAVTDFPLKCYSTGLIANQTVRFLETHKDEPFTLWVSFPDPHTPYEVPEKYMKMALKDNIVLPPWKEGEFNNAPERNKVLHKILGLEEECQDDIYMAIAAYYGLIKFLDDGVGKIMDALERLKLRENTIVVFCSDHGEFAGEHGMLNKGGLFYDCLTRIPLILSWPGYIQSGHIDDSMVNLIDIVPTILSLQGLDMPVSMQGRPLPAVTDEEPRDITFSEYGAGGPPFTIKNLDAMCQPYGLHTLMESLLWREAEGRRKMARTREWKYVHDPLGDKDELYNLLNDPWEQNNIVDDPDNKEVLADLRSRLLDWSIKTEDCHAVPLPVYHKENK